MTPSGVRRLLLATALATLLPASPAPAREPFISTKPTERLDYWQKRQATIAQTLAETPDLSPYKLLFLGDSITDFWLLGDNPWFKGQRNGRAIWDESFTKAPNQALNFGISGDRIEHVLFRIQPKAAGGNGQLDRPDLNPEFIILMLGVNNSYDAEDSAADSINEGVKATVEALRALKPKSRIILQSLLPTSDPAKNREIVAPVNAALAKLATTPPLAGHVLWLNLTPAFETPAGQQRTDLFYDGLHPNEAGYRTWRDQLLPFIEAARAAQAK